MRRKLMLAACVTALILISACNPAEQPTKATQEPAATVPQKAPTAPPANNPSQPSQTEPAGTEPAETPTSTPQQKPTTAASAATEEPQQPPIETASTAEAPTPRPTRESPIMASMSAEERECLPASVQNDHDLMQAMGHQATQHAEAFAISACLSEESLVSIYAADDQARGAETLSTDTYRCLIQADAALAALMPPQDESHTEEAFERAMGIMTAILMTTVPVEAYCMTEEEWARAEPHDDPADRQFTNCVIDELGGPSEFVAVMATMDEHAELGLDQSTQACEAKHSADRPSPRH